MSLINLLPDDYVARQAQKRANLFCAILFGVVVAGVLAAAVVSERAYRRTRDVSERVNRSFDEASKLITQLQQLEATRQKLLKKAKLTSGLLERVPRSYLLASITNALPPGACLTRFGLKSKRETTVQAAPPTRFDKAAAKRANTAKTSTHMAVEISVTGLAATDVEVARFIAAMARCPLMETVELVYSQQKKFKDSVVRDFNIILELKGDADVLGGDGDDQQSVAMGAARHPEEGSQ